MMKQGLKGHVHMFSDHIDTDQIYPGQYLDLTDHKQMALHCLEGVSEHFTKNFQPGDIIVAGVNFGCGSSRENAVIALKEKGVSCVIAKSFARIFYRNAINLGLPLLVYQEDTQLAEDGDQLEVNLDTGLITNLINGKQAHCEPVGEHAMAILRAGGVKPYMRNLDKK